MLEPTAASSTDFPDLHLHRETLVTAEVDVAASEAGGVEEHLELNVATRGGTEVDAATLPDLLEFCVGTLEVAVLAEGPEKVSATAVATNGVASGIASITNAAGTRNTRIAGKEITAQVCSLNSDSGHPVAEASPAGECTFAQDPCQRCAVVWRVWKRGRAEWGACGGVRVCEGV